MRTARSFLASLLMSALWALAAAFPAHAATPRGVALVIGNATYAHAGELANPKNDADDVATAFEAIGYRVIKGMDLDKRAMERTIGEFARALQNADAGVLFYAGHGIQVEGKNYLVPVDARLEDATGVDFELVQLATVQRVMERSVKTNVIFLDACRKNPLARNLARAMGTRSAGAVGRGLASTEAGVGTLISFSTQPGNVALDGTGRNSPYSGALAKHIVGAQSDLSDVLINVRRDVMAATENRQVPWEHSALTDRFYFKPRPADAVGSAIAPAATPDFGLQAEMAFWTAIKDSGQIALLESYLSRYPGGRFTTNARNSIDALKQKQQAEKHAALSPGATGLAQNGNSNSLPSDQQRLAEMLQRELKRVGCYPGAIDGNWGSGSESAMTDYNTHAKMAFQTNTPTAAAVSAISKVLTRICPDQSPDRATGIAPPGTSQRRSGGTCIDGNVDVCKAACAAGNTRACSTWKSLPASVQYSGGTCATGNMDHCRLACSRGIQRACARLGK